MQGHPSVLLEAIAEASLGADRIVVDFGQQFTFVGMRKVMSTPPIIRRSMGDIKSVRGCARQTCRKILIKTCCERWPS